MYLSFYWDINILVELSDERADSPEELLVKLEEALESGQLTLEEVTQFIADLNKP